MIELPRRDQHQFGRAIVRFKPRLQVRRWRFSGSSPRFRARAGQAAVREKPLPANGRKRCPMACRAPRPVPARRPSSRARGASARNAAGGRGRRAARRQAARSGASRRVEGGQLAVGRGVEIAADILDRLADLSCRAAARALEHHMLEQMRDAVERRRLIARAGRRKEPDGHGLDALHRPAGDAKPVG